MNKHTVLLFLIAGFYSCKKEQEPASFGIVEYQPILLGDSIISKTSTELKIHLDFLSLDPNSIEYPLLQGNVGESLIEIDLPPVSDYSFVYSNFQLSETLPGEHYSALILIDKTFGNYNFDECLSYSIKNLKESNELAFGGYSDAFETNGYRIYGDGFVNSDSENKYEGLFDAYSEELTGNENPLQAAYTALDYLAENALNVNKSLILFTFNAVAEDEPILADLIQKANDLNIKISFVARHNYDFTEIAIKTGGFHSYQFGSPRIVSYSLDKLLAKHYYTSSIDLTINKLTGTFNNTPSFGFYIDLKTTSNEISQRLYYHVFN
jgi:hypothetical protein